MSHLRNHTTLKRQVVKANEVLRLSHLRNHTTLKQISILWWGAISLSHLRNHTTLKQASKRNGWSIRLSHLRNHTTLKPQIRVWDSKACPVTTKCDSVNAVISNKSRYLKYTH